MGYNMVHVWVGKCMAVNGKSGGCEKCRCMGVNGKRVGVNCV